MTLDSGGVSLLSVWSGGVCGKESTRGVMVWYNVLESRVVEVHVKLSGYLGII